MFRVLALLALVLAVPAHAQDRRIVLAVPPALEASGLLSYILPRFSLKTRIGVDPAPGAHAAEGLDGADLALAPQPIPAPPGAPPARPVFRDPDGTLYAVRLARAPGQDGDRAEHSQRFAEWLTSDVGQATIAGFAEETGLAYAGAASAKRETEEVLFEGDAARGEKLSLALCGRCHVVGEVNRMKGLGSTPSFMALRAMRDWDARFSAFYVLNPHPAFTQVEGVTGPFDKRRPSPIAPVEMTLGDLDAILAFVQEMEPADLGAPVQAN